MERRSNEISPKREIYLCTKDQRQIPLTRVGEPLLLSSIEEEAVDLYVYRLAEKKSMNIGKVTRILKQISVDCILNIKQTNFTVENLYSIVENKRFSTINENELL